MSANLSLRPVVGYLHQLAAKVMQTEATDRQLLERYARDRDEEAFRCLVRRHGPLVIGVSRRALRHREDAEDCFQATFLVLARKAGVVRWHDSVAGWLHQAATRLAKEIRMRDAQRQRREQLVAAQSRSGPADDAAFRELGAVLDEELQQLPERCRVPLLLCHLQGMTRDQAARQLGLSLRTLERRLEIGRELLRHRLARRGLTLSAVLVAWGIAQAAVAAVPGELIDVTVRAGTAFALGTVASRAGALAAHALRAMVWQKVRWTAGLVVAAGLFVLAGGVGGGVPASVASDPLSPVQVGASAPPAAKGESATKPPASGAKLQEVATAAAVQEGLKWLVRQQAPGGGWKLDGGQPNDTAATAFGLLPLLASGEGQDAKGQFGPNAGAVRRGLKFLVGTQHADGSFNGGMYAHALATLALCDGYRLTADPNLKKPAQSALAFIVKSQHEAGGWRYAPGQPGDTSVTSWHVLALKRGKDADLQVPAAVFKKVSAYLDTAARQGGTYGYVPEFGGGVGTATMTAGGLLCRHCTGWAARHPTILEGAAFVAKTPPGPTNAYYNHFATRLMQAVGGPEWDAWEAQLVPMLLRRQEHGGTAAGSWPAAGDVYGPGGGRLMVTSLSLLSLQACGWQTPPTGAAKELKEGEAANCWDDLAEADYRKVKIAMQRLGSAPGQTVALLRDRLRPVPPADAAQVAKLIARLDADEFEQRDAAFKELQGLGERAAAPLAQALKTAVTLELRRRLERLLDALDADARSPSALRQLRAVQVLELAGSPEARQLLKTLSEGAPRARITQAAKEALDREAR